MDQQHQSAVQKIWKLLERIPDPEIPVINIVELGIVRHVEAQGDQVRVHITPTYSGCPALDHMKQAVRDLLKKEGYVNVVVETVYAPAWSTDWISEHAREKLKQFGIAPPGPVPEEDLLVTFPRKQKPVACPFCNSVNTELRAEFSSTACKSMHFCLNCTQPFEHFKAF